MKRMYCRNTLLGSGALVAAAALIAAVTPAAQAVTPPPGTLGSKPFLRLANIVSPAANFNGGSTDGCMQSQQVNNGPTTLISKIAKAYAHVNDEGANTFTIGDSCQGGSPTTLAEKLRSFNSTIKVSIYRNGSAVSQSGQGLRNFQEAADLEGSHPLGAATFWPGNADPKIAGNDNSTAARLTGSLSASATTVKVTSASALKPTGAPTTWPYVASNGSGAFSHDTQSFVSWIRVDDELMKITAAPTLASGVVTLRVTRGLWGTGATAHNNATRVMSPDYIGTKTRVPGDILNGSPYHNDPTVSLRYGIKIWKPDGYGWIANRIQELGLGGLGYNAIWLDVSSCFIFQNADALGNPVLPWDDNNATKMTNSQWGAYQKVKVDNLKNLLPQYKYTANNLINTDSCTRNLLANAYDYGSLESWMKNMPNVPTAWPPAMAQNFDIQNNNLPAIYWVRWERAGNNYTNSIPQLQRFSYASLLLAYNPANTAFQYAGQFGFDVPPQLYYWNWGKPTTQPTSLAQVQLKGTPLYRRVFPGGWVIANATANPVTYNLPTTKYDIIHLDGQGKPTPVNSVTIPSGDAAFLLNKMPP